MAEGAGAGVSQPSQHLLPKDHDLPSDDVSELVSVAEFRQRAGAAVRASPAREPLAASREDLRTAMALDEEEFRELEQHCSVMQLMPVGGMEAVLSLKPSELPRDSPLQTICHHESTRHLLDKRGMGMNSLTAPIPGPPVSGPGQSGGSRHVTMPEVILSFLLFHPIKKRVDQEWLVLGCQLLSELRDKIYCSTDFVIEEDFSADPTAFDRKAAEEAQPRSSHSALFFINNTFYNDHRHPLSTDYSKVVCDWMQQEAREELSPRLDHFQTADMGSTRFDELSLRLGYPYLFLHHGNCEHLLIARDLRLMHATDRPSHADYPRLVFQHRGKNKRCSVCRIFTCAWVTRNDELAPESPCFFCEECFQKLHYSATGAKLCSFEAFPFHPKIIA